MCVIDPVAIYKSVSTQFRSRQFISVKVSANSEINFFTLQLREETTDSSRLPIQLYIIYNIYWTSPFSDACVVLPEHWDKEPSENHMEKGKTQWGQEQYICILFAWWLLTLFMVVKASNDRHVTSPKKKKKKVNVQ